MNFKGNKNLSRKKDLKKKLSKSKQTRNLARRSCIQQMAGHRVKDQEILNKKMLMKWGL